MRIWDAVFVRASLVVTLAFLWAWVPLTRSPAYAQPSDDDSTPPASGKEKQPPRRPVIFTPETKKPPVLKPLPRPTNAQSNHFKKQDVVVLPFALSKFQSVTRMMAELGKLLPGATRRELTRMAWQMLSDSQPIPPDLGGVFIPNIIQRENVAPASYAIYDKNDRPVAITQTGKKSFVYPGEYTVRIGRLANSLLPTYKIRVYRHKMTVIRPRWGALIVRVVDERLIQFRGTYDLIHLRSRVGIGTGIGADDTLGEKVRPWLIPPGLYMIVRVGDSYLARTNYFTVQVDQGNVTTFRLVVDKNTNQFLGGGVLLRSQRGLGEGAWRWSLQLNGNLLLNYANNVGGSTNGISFSMAAFLFGRVIYSKNQHFFSSTLNAELGFTLPTQGPFRKGADRLELQSIYVYRVLPWLGPYLRANFETVMLPDWWNFPDEEKFTRQNVSIYNCVSAVCRLRETIQVTGGQQLPQLQLNSVFDPILLKQGLGVNIQPLNSVWINLRLLFGLGFRQEISREVFQFNPNTDVYTARCKNLNPANPNPTDLSNCPNPSQQEQHTSVLLFSQGISHREGLEIAIVATGQLTRYISYTFEVDALAPFEFSEAAKFINFNNFEIDGRLTVILRLSHYASLNFRLRVRRNPILAQTPEDPEGSKWSIDLSNALSFSLLF